MSLELPLRIAGLEAGDLVLVDRSSVRLFDGAGRLLYSGINAGTFQLNPIPLNAISSAGGARTGTQRVLLPESVYRRVAGQPVRLQLDYSLTLMGRVALHRIAAEEGFLRGPDVGLCATRVDMDSFSIALRCRQLGRAPSCLSVVLFGPHGERDPEVSKCDPDYRPDLPGFTDVLWFYGLDVPVRDPLGVAHYPVEPSQLGRSSLAVSIYRARDHFTRTLLIPQVRLDAFRG